MQRLLCFIQDESGVTAVEYAVMLALIILVCITVVASIGTQTSDLFDPGGQLSGALTGS